MARIAGIAGRGKQADVQRMLNRMRHRGTVGCESFETPDFTLGAVWTDAQPRALAKERATVEDSPGEGHFARAEVRDGKLVLSRDWVGVAPLYYGITQEGLLCFASEVRAILTVTRDVREFPPGYRFDGVSFELCTSLPSLEVLADSPRQIARELKRRLQRAVAARVRDNRVGTWLSGGLDSSALTALAKPLVRPLHTFAGGLVGAPDLAHARIVSDFLHTEHHEVILTLTDLLNALPDVIYHLESFDALLVRSSVVNYMVGKAASDYVAEVFSGEGGDELFAGYEYLKEIAPSELLDELIDITGRLHNTALQRVDRSSAAHGLAAHVCFLDPDVAGYALRIPIELKLRDGVEKWILRQAMDGMLPRETLERRKSKFWEGAGVGDLLARHADETISDRDFVRERRLSNGWELNTKEELMYYRIFAEHFGQTEDFSWMGRTKAAPMIT